MVSVSVTVLAESIGQFPFRSYTITINIKMFLHKEFHPIVLFSFAMIPKRGLTNNSYTGQTEAAGPSLKIYRNKCTCRYAELNIVVVCTCTT